MLFKNLIISLLIPVSFTLPQLLKAQNVGKKANKSATETAAKAIPEKYTQLEMQANVAFTNGNFDEASVLYRRALKLQPDAQWPIWQLSKIEAEKLAAERRKYKTICDFCYTKYRITGDSALNMKAYSLAKSAYIQALSYKNTDSYVASQLVKVEKLAKDENYAESMRAGRNALSSSSLSEAEAAFQQALNLKANDVEAKRGLAEVAARKKALAKKGDVNSAAVNRLKQYRDTLSIADQLFKTASYEAAKRLYKKAEQLKPGDTYSRNRIAEIDNIFSVQKQLQDRNKLDVANAGTYTNTISMADKAYEAGDLKKARPLYKSAQQFSTDNYPAQRISAIDSILLEDQRKKTAVGKQLKTETGSSRYNQLVRAANTAFERKDYQKARDYFLEALAIRPAETVPRAQVQLINRKLEEQRIEEKYKYFVRLADSTAFQVMDPQEALRYYDSAHTVKPKEGYAKTQIILINDQLLRVAARTPIDEKQRQRTEKFNEAFKVYRKADEARIEKKFSEAYTGFNAFLDQVDTENINLYQIRELYYINQAKDYMQQLQTYKPGRMESVKYTPQDDRRKRVNIERNK